MALSKSEGRQRRKWRIRKNVAGTSERPRLSVFRSAKHIYAQVIDDTTGTTLASVSTISKGLRGSLAGNKRDVAKKIGGLIAERCKAANISKVVFDRNGFLYHGRVKALAEAAREGGLEF